MNSPFRRRRAGFVPDVGITTPIQAISPTPSESPVQRLLPEILSRIFFFCLSEEYTRPSATSAPLLLGQICSYWRRISLSTPSLWSSISVRRWESGFPKSLKRDRDGQGIRSSIRRIFRPRSVSQEVDVYSSMMNAWLSRSGALPLSIELSLLHLVRVNSDRFVLEVALAYCHRWQNIVLWMDDDVLLEFVREIKREGIPRLECLTIRRVGLRDPEEPICAFESAPRLHCVALYHHPRALSLPWGQLTDIYVCLKMPVHDCLHMMQHCCNLIEGTLQICEGQGLSSPVSGYVTLPFVRALHIISNGFIGNVFDHLRTPVLEYVFFELEDTDPETLWPHKQFVTFLLSVQSSLRSLRLHNTNMTEHNLIECLQSAPALAEFSLVDFQIYRHNPITDQVFDLLTYRGTSADAICLCPKLEIICMLGGHNAYKDQSILEMVESRWVFQSPMSHNGDQSKNSTVVVLPAGAPPGRPSRLKMVAFWIQAKEVCQRMEIFKHEGLDVRFLYCTDAIYGNRL